MLHRLRGEFLEIVLIILILVALAAALWLRQAGRAEQAQAGLPVEARVVYTDTGAWRRVEKSLFSRRYRLTGKPDYIVEDETGALIPIEVKPGRRDPVPRRADTMQLMAYGILVEEEYGTRPEHGLLKYRDQVFEIEFTEELRAELFETLGEMRIARGVRNVARSHDDATRCRYCGYRDGCDERLS